jgi:hypothetical protein
MSDLFYTGQRRHTGGSFTVNMKDGAKLAKRLKKLEDGGKVAIKRTVSDFTNRAPAWVSKGIREHYGVDTAAIKDAGPRKKKGATSVKVAGVQVDGVALEYKGRILTTVHFKQSPKQRPTAQQAKPLRIPGQAIAGAGDVAMIRPPKKYKVKATIIKGQRATLPANTFIAAGNGGVSLPFQRTSEARMPIEAVHTLSVPQMIEGRARETIQESISDKLGNRFEHHIKQAMK